MSIETFRLTELTLEGFNGMIAPSKDDTPVVTLRMSTERKGAETRKNRIRFKNLVTQAETLLPGHGEGSEDLSERLGELARELDEPTHAFWQHQEEGLALVVRAQGPPAAYLLPFAIATYAGIGRRPELGPLLRLLGGVRAQVLVLDLDALRLFKATRWSAAEIPLSDVPTSLAEAMKFDDPEKSLQQRTVSSANLPGPGGGNVAFHGHGITGDETRKKKVRRFFEMVDKGLAKNFEDREAPLVLFGPDDQVALYREINHYPHLAEENLIFNPSHLAEEALTEKIRAWAADHDATTRDGARTSLEEHLAKGSGSVDVEEVVKAAKAGRVAAIFVRAGERRYGVHDPEGDRVTLHEAREPGDEELVGAAATAAATTGADVWFVEADDEELPEGAAVAAVYRY